MNGPGRLYRVLLRLLPEPLRRRHAAAMEALFLEALRDAPSRPAWVLAWMRGAVDVIRRALYERARTLRTPMLGDLRMTGLATDLRFALRGFVRQPAVTSLVVFLLALGIAAGTAVFSLVNGIFLRPLPFPEPDRLVHINETAPTWNLDFTGVNYRDFLAWRENARVFEAMGLLTDASFNVSDDEGAERVTGASVTHDLAAALGVRPLAGRTFTPEEDSPGGAPVVMIGQRFWERRFSASPEVIGQTLRIDGTTRTIVGVLPTEAEFPRDVELWLPLALEVSEVSGSYSYDGVGRLKPGVTLEAAEADLHRAHTPIWEEHDTAHVVSPVVLPLTERIVGELRGISIALGSAVVLVLLIACANVASILLARSFARRRELGLRVALGAGSGRLARQLLTESLALSLVAGPLGILAGFWTVRLLVRAVPDQLPGWMQLGLDWRMALFGAAMMGGTAVLFGWAPVLQARRQPVRDALSEGGSRSGASRGQRRTMSGLVVAEIALAALLLVAGGLLLRSFERLRDIDPGFRTDSVLAFNVALPSPTYPDSAARWGFYRDLLGRIEGLPGVRAAGAITCLPLTCHWGSFFEVEGIERDPEAAHPVVLYRYASPAYFEAMGIRLLRGRFFEEGAGQGPPSVVINETFAREFLPGVEDPVGRRINFEGGDEESFTIIGVAGDVKHYGVETPMRPGLYFPLEPQPQSGLAIAVWSSVTPTSLLGPIRGIMRELDPELPLYRIFTMEERMADSLAVRRASVWLMAVFAGIALALALGGIYGVLSYAVGQRRREFGIRLALGAERGDVLGLVLRQGLALAGTGLAIGLLGAFALGTFMRSLLTDLSPRDPATFAAVAIVLGVAAAAACLAPARRALSVEPQAALREE